ncbi:MAG: NAD(P)-binding domain-containing protein [Polyangiales bacterium]
MSELLPIGVVGGGAFGRGIAKAAARTGHPVHLWSRSARDLGDARVHVTSRMSDVARGELIFLAVPSTAIAELSTELGVHLDGSHLLVHVSRGLVGAELTPISRLLRDTTPARRVGALAGPLIAEALIEGTPSGAIVGTNFPEVSDAVREAIAGPTLRLYTTRDIVGVEVASAVVGLLALAAGHAQASGVGPAALATFLTRGVVEAGRIAASFGAEADTFHGLAGVGDLLAVMAGDERPEERLGRELATGATLAQAVERVGVNIEGVTLARRVAEYGVRERLSVPICTAIADVIDGMPAEEALRALMTRGAS